MQTKTLILFAASSIAALASPPVESIGSNSLMALTRKWRHDTWAAPEPFTIAEPLPANLPGGYQPADAIYWERFTTQTIAVGDIIVYVSTTTGKDIVREVGAISPAIKTTRNFVVTHDKLLGLIRRVVRISAEEPPPPNDVPVEAPSQSPK